MSDDSSRTVYGVKVSNGTEILGAFGSIEAANKHGDTLLDDLYDNFSILGSYDTFEREIKTIRGEWVAVDQPTTFFERNE